MPRFNFKILIYFLLFQIILFRVSIYAQEVAVPVETQLPLIIKILSFDRNLKSKLTGDLTFGIVYQKNFRGSVNIKNDIIKAIENLNVSSFEGIPISYKLIPISNTYDLENYLSSNKINVLYFAPLRAINISEISSITHKYKVLSITGVPDYVQYDKIALGIDLQAYKPIIIISMEAYRAEGSDFSSQLLKLSKVLK